MFTASEFTGANIKFHVLTAREFTRANINFHVCAYENERGLLRVQIRKT